MPASRRSFVLAAALTALLVASRQFPQPALMDAVTGRAPEGMRLVIPLGHLAMTPLSMLGDIAACSSGPQAISLLFFLICLVGPFRWGVLGHGRVEWNAALPALRAFALHSLILVAILAWGVLWPRAPARLEIDDPALMPVDFHSHTSFSWDGRGWFTPKANLAWHGRAGFAAAFITDHNRVEGAREALRLSREAWNAGRRKETVGLSGEELSLHDAHVLLLGGDHHADPDQYRGLEGLRRFLGDAGPVFSGLAVMSLPEYYRHHRGRLDDLADWGAAGYEIVAASPRGLAAPMAFRESVVELCRRRNLFMTGGSDNHGYGSTSCVWSLVRVVDWRTLGPAERERAVLSALRSGGFSAVRVIARARCLEQPRSGLSAWLDAPHAFWDAMCSWTLAQALVALAWAWGIAAVCAALGNKVT